MGRYQRIERILKSTSGGFTLLDSGTDLESRQSDVEHRCGFNRNRDRDPAGLEMVHKVFYLFVLAQLGGPDDIRIDQTGSQWIFRDD